MESVNQAIRHFVSPITPPLTIPQRSSAMSTSAVVYPHPFLTGDKKTSHFTAKHLARQTAPRDSTRRCVAPYFCCDEMNRICDEPSP